MLPARLRSAVANEDVRLSVLDTPLEMVLVMVSLRESGGRIGPGAEALGNMDGAEGTR